MTQLKKAEPSRENLMEHVNMFNVSVLNTKLQGLMNQKPRTLSNLNINNDIISKYITIIIKPNERFYN